MQHSTWHTLVFAFAICAVCGVLVSTSAVTLNERQEVNVELEKKQNVLLAAGLMKPDERIDAEEVRRRFEKIEALVIRLDSGTVVPEIDPLSFDQQKAKADPETSRKAPANLAKVSRLPEHALVYRILDSEGRLEMTILPVEGYGLWSTLYGFLALDRDTTTIRGLTFYQHGETPGLGGEVDNPNWKALWVGRKAFDSAWNPKISVIKGQAGRAADDPHRVDGLSGASITSRGVTNLLQFWLGESGFGPYLDTIRHPGGA